MNESLHLASIARLVEEMLEATGPGERDRILLDAAFELEAAQSAAVWRRIRGWRSVLERGPIDALPGYGLVEGVLEDGLDRNLPGRGVVLRVDGAATALVLGEVENPDGRVDLLEALLHLGSVLAGPGDADGDADGEGLAAALPEGPDSPPDAGTDPEDPA